MERREQAERLTAGAVDGAGLQRQHTPSELRISCRDDRRVEILYSGDVRLSGSAEAPLGEREEGSADQAQQVI